MLTRVLIIVLVTNAALAQRPGFKLPAWAKHRLFSLSAESPMLKHMVKQEGFNESAHTLISFFSTVDDTILSSLRNQSVPTPIQLFKPCAGENPRYLNSINTVFGVRGWPVPVYNCLTDVVGPQLFSDQQPKYTTNELFGAVNRISALLTREKHYLLATILLKMPPHTRVLANWTKPVAMTPFPWTRDRKKCALHVIGFMRVHDFWYFSIGVGNARKTHASLKWKRQSFGERVYVGPNGANAHTLLQRLPSYINDTFDGPSVNGTTTHFSRGKGRTQPSAFYRVYPEDNPALIASMAAADRPIRQTIDALRPSGLCILLLPLLFSLLPVAAVTYVGARVMLIYILCSDIVPVVPLLIKGVELIVIGSQRFRTVAVRIENNMNGTRGEAAAGQLWTAECSSEVDARVPGIVFVVLAVFAMVFGVWLELWTRKFVLARKQRTKDLYTVYMRIGTNESYDNYRKEKGMKAKEEK